MLQETIFRRINSPGYFLPPLVYWLLLILLFFAASAWIANTPMAHLEIDQYIPHYLSSKTILSKIFDPSKVEIPGVYRPRPLSYIVDNLDVNFIGWCARQGYPHLLSLSYFVFKLLDCVIFFYLFRCIFRLSQQISLLLICLFVTTPDMILGGNFFRSAKPGALFFLATAFVCFCILYKASVQESPKARQLGLGIMSCFILLFACLFDEVPVAFGLGSWVVLAIAYFMSPMPTTKSASAKCLLALGATILLFFFYNFFIQPRLVQAITGRPPDMSYQAGLGSAIFHSLPLHLVASPWILFDSFGFVAGNLPPVVMAALTFVMVFVWIYHFSGNATRFSSILFGTAVSLLLIVLFGMISRHQFIMRFGVRRSYVGPFEAVFLIFLGAFLMLLIQHRRISLRGIEVCLFCLLLSNIVAAPANMVITLGEHVGQDDRGHFLMQALRHGTKGLSGQEVEKVTTNPIYRALHEQMVTAGTERTKLF
jgi:hypothetical protein